MGGMGAHGLEIKEKAEKSAGCGRTAGAFVRPVEPFRQGGR